MYFWIERNVFRFQWVGTFIIAYVFLYKKFDYHHIFTKFKYNIILIQHNTNRLLWQKQTQAKCRYYLKLGDLQPTEQLVLHHSSCFCFGFADSSFSTFDLKAKCLLFSNLNHPIFSQLKLPPLIFVLGFVMIIVMFWQIQIHLCYAELLFLFGCLTTSTQFLCISLFTDILFYAKISIQTNLSVRTPTILNNLCWDIETI